MTTYRMPSILSIPMDIAAEQFRNTLRQDILWSLNGRFERGVTLAKQGAVSPYSDPNCPDKSRLFQVRSSNQSRPPYAYLVDLDIDRCECPDHAKGYYCKHIIASHIFEIVNQKLQAAKTATINTPSYQVQSKETTPISECALNTSELNSETNNLVKNDSVIWGVIKHEGQWLGVEILTLDEDNATIRALPKIIEGKKLQPQFPFQGKRCTITLPKKHIFHVKIFQ